ncbi:MAG: hypothetical protein E7049_08205 [Lentisphaerae bacterium]|nr:hypothetical protein [Lentisphaerota bacterium]
MLSHNQITWLLEALAGSGPLGKILFAEKDRLDFSAAKVFPDAAKDWDFRCGLPADKQFCGGWMAFASELKRNLKCDGAFCLFRECDFKKNDPCMALEKSAMVFAGDDIFYIIDGSSDDVQIAETIKTANRFMLMCLISGGESKFVKGDNVTYAQIERVLGGLLAVAVGVCDDEGVCFIPCRSKWSEE